MKCSPAERAQRKRFDEAYLRGRLPVMRSVERCVFGCDYGATSWTTRDEAERLGALLDLRPGVRLLDVGAGSGWPGLYLAETTGCDVVLVDLPLEGLRIPAARAAEDRIRGACWAAVASAADLPFRDNSFAAISHSDVLCCLGPKRAVLEACRGVIGEGGRMVFSVLLVAPGLSSEDYRRAVENAPEFVESECDYPTMLGQTGWSIVDRHDISAEFEESCRRQMRADEANKGALEKLIGAPELAERQAGWHTKLAAIKDGILRRELYVATPEPA